MPEHSQDFPFAHRLLAAGPSSAAQVRGDDCRPGRIADAVGDIRLDQRVLC